MKRFVSMALAAALSLLSATPAAFAAPQDDRLAVPVDPGQFKLYDSPSFHPSPECDVHTSLLIVIGIAGPLARLQEKLSGSCRIYVAPNTRHYNLRGQEGMCGRKFYTGQRWVSVPGHPGRRERATIRITDNRKFHCERRVYPLIVVEETGPRGSKTLYSYDESLTPREERREGVIYTMFAIGGETTGYGLKTSGAESIELELKGDLRRRADAVRDQDVRVTVEGYFENRTGVEIPLRKVFVVTRLTVLRE